MKPIPYYTYQKIKKLIEDGADWGSGELAKLFLEFPPIAALVWVAVHMFGWGAEKILEALPHESNPPGTPTNPNAKPVADPRWVEGTLQHEQWMKDPANARQWAAWKADYKLKNPADFDKLEKAAAALRARTGRLPSFGDNPEDFLRPDADKAFDDFINGRKPLTPLTPPMEPLAPAIATGQFSAGNYGQGKKRVIMMARYKDVSLQHPRTRWNHGTNATFMKVGF